MSDLRATFDRMHLGTEGMGQQGVRKVSRGLVVGTGPELERCWVGAAEGTRRGRLGRPGGAFSAGATAS